MGTHAGIFRSTDNQEDNQLLPLFQGENEIIDIIRQKYIFNNYTVDTLLVAYLNACAIPVALVKKPG